jgi:hypothetical protein
MLAHLNDTAVIAVLDGTASPQILAHYDQCRECRAYVAQQRQIEEALYQLFAGDSCPSGEQITAFVLGELDRRQHHTIEAHIDGCEACTRDLKHMQRFLQPPKAASPRPSFQAAWAGLHQANLPLSTALPIRPVVWQKGAALANAGAPIRFVAEIDGVFITLMFSRKGHRSYTFEGQTSTDSAMQPPLIGARAILMVDDAVHEPMIIDEFGFFYNDSVPAGSAVLYIQTADSILIFPDINLAA